MHISRGNSWVDRYGLYISSQKPKYIQRHIPNTTHTKKSATGMNKLITENNIQCEYFQGIWGQTGIRASAKHTHNPIVPEFPFSNSD